MAIHGSFRIGTRGLPSGKPGQTVAFPHYALGNIGGWLRGCIGIASVLSEGLVNLQGMTLIAVMITLSVFGAIVMYIISMLSLFKLRRSELQLERPFRAPAYTVVPSVALVLVVLCLVATGT